MSLRLLFAVCILFSCVCMNGCTKNSSTGPQGAQGVVGPAGASGTIIYSGTVAPDPSLGNAGDFYLDLTSDVLFGPKTASGWGAGFSMKGSAGAAGAAGATGAAGAAGSKIYSGSDAPDVSLGVLGDYYLDITNFNLYGPKIAAGWGLPITLQGPAGTANVEYTPWFKPGYADSITDLVYTDVTVNAISPNLADNGTILVYSTMNCYSASVWPENYMTGLPVTVNFTPMPGQVTPASQTWSAVITAQDIRLELYSADNAVTASQMTNNYFRVVLIPGGVSIPAGIGFEDLLRYMRTKVVN
jgi:hypothetical protein